MGIHLTQTLIDFLDDSAMRQLAKRRKEDECIPIHSLSTDSGLPGSSGTISESNTDSEK